MFCKIFWIMRVLVEYCSAFSNSSHVFPPVCFSVITELDGLAKGQESRDGDSVGGGGAAHARLVQEQAKAAVAFLEKGFEAREPGLRALTSRGNQLESFAFRSADTSGQKVCVCVL